MNEATGPTAEVHETPPAATAQSKPPVKKLVVAVHGIGKQFRYATIKSVAEQFGIYCNGQVGTPLGAFHPAVPGDPEAIPLPRPNASFEPPAGLEGVMLAEIFWANIPDEAVKAADTIEETKDWAKTVVERLRALDCAKNNHPTINYEKTSAVVDEMIQTIGVLENLLFLGRKTGVANFELQQVLTDYVCDIQIVTEFSDYRRKILQEFDNTLAKLTKKHDPDEIHIVAHSEGTVVSILGLLAAMSQKQMPEWAKRVTGYMTIGSPIDKHLAMWPSLFEAFKPTGANQRGRTPILWKNYYDNGDPVGFELDTAREWMIEQGWMSDPPKPTDYFHFTAADDLGFTRYYLPGKAHNDYWKDPEVFGHFIKTVVQPSNREKPEKVRKPRTNWTAAAVSWVIPYIICFLLLLAGTYVVYKQVSISIDADPTVAEMARNVIAISLLLAGMTVFARVPRLADASRGYIGSLVTVGISAYLYTLMIDPAADRNISGFTGKLLPGGSVSIVWVTSAIAILAGIISYLKPRWGLKPLIMLVALTLGAVLWSILGDSPKADRKLWPVALGGVAFVYLWWLAALLFDLVFVWHRYIRGSVATTVLRRIRKRKPAGQQTEPVVMQTAPSLS
jgi:hypothetical protein